MVETGTHAEELARHVVGALMNGLSNRLVAVVLFGSRARGEGSETSDWDLLVIAEGLPAKTFDRNLYLKQLIPLEWRGRVSILAKTPEQFHGAVSSLYLDVPLEAHLALASSRSSVRSPQGIHGFQADEVIFVIRDQNAVIHFGDRGHRGFDTPSPCRSEAGAGHARPEGLRNKSDGYGISCPVFAWLAQ